jgi:chorismate dehydratase
VKRATAWRAPEEMLRIGCVKYLNARPLIRGWDSDVDFDHPSALCHKLAAADLDFALVSSFEFLRNPIYRIVGDVSISSDGPVYSVVVAHRGKISEVRQIELDPASETSANLLRILLGKLGLNPNLVSGNVADALGAKHDARLLIGDQAIRFRRQWADEFSFLDLGEQWQKLVGLPFVYALWLVRPEVADPKQVADRLRALRDENLANLDSLITDVAAGSDDPGDAKLDQRFLRSYYRENLRFGLGQREKEGLRTFARMCAVHDVIPRRNFTFHLV